MQSEVEFRYMGKKVLKVKDLKDTKWSKISKKIVLYQYRSGEEFFFLVFKSGLSDDEILSKLKQYDVKMSKSELEYYRMVLTNPFLLGKRLTYDIIEYLSSRFGLYRVNVATLLSEIIFLGRANLWKSQKVSVSELLKAIQLQKELIEGVSSKRIMDEIEKLLNSNDNVGQDQRSEEKELLSEDRV